VAANWPLLLGMGMLMLGGGLQGTLLSVRASHEGFATIVIGVVMSCYYVGYIGGSLGTPRLIQRVGHIRVFAALTAVASVTILLQAVYVAPLPWALLRLTTGFCFAGIYVVAESWLNDRASNENRGSLLAVYMMVLYVGLGAGQFLLNVADPAGPLLFIIISVTISLAVVPMTLSVQHAPQHALPHRIGWRELFHASPLGVVGVVLSGMVTSSMFSMGPVYAHLIGLTASSIAAFMGCGILATVVVQLPIGRWSDRVDRRTVLVTICLLACASAALSAVFGHRSEPLLFALMACFGGIALTLYSLSVSHINDQLQSHQMVGASGTVMLLNGAGSISGPFLVATLMQSFGPASYFTYLAALTGVLATYGLYRKARRAPVPAEHKGPFVIAQPQAVSGEMISEIALSGTLAQNKGVEK
jgi:MFS family permease